MSEAGPERQGRCPHQSPPPCSLYPSEGWPWELDFTESTPSGLTLGSNSHNSESSLVPISWDVMVLRFPLLTQLCGPELWQGQMAPGPPRDQRGDSPVHPPMFTHTALRLRIPCACLGAPYSSSCRLAQSCQVIGTPSPTVSLKRAPHSTGEPLAQLPSPSCPAG